MASEALATAVKAMTDPTSKSLFDVTIICTTDDFQAEYWMQRLSNGVCKKPDEATSSKFPLVLAVSEDWSKGGAGNGLGTLYAFEKACLVAKDLFDIDLAAMMNDKTISAALYHTAGKGTRLAPFPASENNNKPGVKLPVSQKLSDGSYAPITVLEAVVKQTGVYAPSRKGRLSVFWGDQVRERSLPQKFCIILSLAVSFCAFKQFLYLLLNFLLSFPSDLHPFCPISIHSHTPCGHNVYSAW